MSIIPLVYFRKHALLSILVVFAVMLAQSRQGMILCLFNIVVLLLFGKKRDLNSGYIFFFVVLSLFFYYVIIDLPFIEDLKNVIIDKFSLMNDIRSDSSSASRLSTKWPYYLSLFFGNIFTILLGIGRMKDPLVYNIGTPDSELMHISLAFGIFVSMLLCIFIYIFLLRVSSIVLRVVLFINFAVNFFWSSFIFEFISRTKNGGQRT